MMSLCKLVCAHKYCLSNFAINTQNIHTFIMSFKSRIPEYKGFQFDNLEIIKALTV